jgi:hypothetical protein
LYISPTIEPTNLHFERSILASAAYTERHKGRASFDIFHQLLIYKIRHGTEGYNLGVQHEELYSKGYQGLEIRALERRN